MACRRQETQVANFPGTENSDQRGGHHIVRREAAATGARVIERRCVEGMSWDGSTCAGVASTFTHEAALQHAAGDGVGVGIAVCAACCAGPMLAAVVGTAVFIGVATFVAGAVGLGVALLIAVAFARRWRRRQCAPESVAVPTPTRRDKISDRR